MPIDQAQIETLAYVYDLLFDAADRSDGLMSDGRCDWCHDEGCTLEKPYCETQKARRARRELDRLMNPPLESLHPERLRNPAERIYHEVWAKDNTRSPGWNSGFTTLEWILCPEGQRHPSPVTHRDAQVATSVIQWLGTNCGLALVREAERRINEERAERANIEGYAVNRDPAEGDPKPKLDEWAHIIASMCKPITHMGLSPLEKVIRTALYKAYRAGRNEAENFVCGTS